MKEAINPYIEYSKSDDIHGTALYPAVMIAPVQRDLLKEVLPDRKNIKVCDPFAGSGTAIYEAARLNPDISIMGSDINPLAILITRVKLEGVDEGTIEQDIGNLRRSIQGFYGPIPAPDFSGIDKWFKLEIKYSLSRLKQAIGAIERSQHRRFFWYMLIDIVRKYCNSRSSTYKLHMRSQAQIDKIEDQVVKDYLAKIESEWELFTDVQRDHDTLNQGDSIDFLRSLEDNSIDVCITSPPYGDNGTTVPYGQYSTLAMLWIDPADMNLEGWELTNYASIDSRSLGGWANPCSRVEAEGLGDLAIMEAIQSISHGKRRKVIRFLNGYKDFLDELMRVTASSAILTLGNRTVDGVCIDLAGYTERYLRSKGAVVEERMKRPIVRKRTPPRVSTVNGAPVASMKEERVLIATFCT